MGGSVLFGRVYSEWWMVEKGRREGPNVLIFLHLSPTPTLALALSLALSLALAQRPWAHGFISVFSVL